MQHKSVYEGRREVGGGRKGNSLALMAVEVFWVDHLKLVDNVFTFDRHTVCMQEVVKWEGQSQKCQSTHLHF